MKIITNIEDFASLVRTCEKTIEEGCADSCENCVLVNICGGNGIEKAFDEIIIERKEVYRRE